MPGLTCPLATGHAIDASATQWVLGTHGLSQKRVPNRQFSPGIHNPFPAKGNTVYVFKEDGKRPWGAWRSAGNEGGGIVKALLILG